MNRSRQLPLFLAIVAMGLAVTACTRLTQWIPVQDGSDLVGDHIVHYEGIEIAVREFGVYDLDSSPTAEVRTLNRGRKPVAFGIDGFRLDVGGRLVPAVLNEAGEFPSIYLEPGEIYNTRLTFNDPVGGAQALPEMLYLHLAPLVIEEVYHELPVLAFRNPGK